MAFPKKFHIVPEPTPEVERIEAAEAFFAIIPATVNHGGDRAETNAVAFVERRADSRKLGLRSGEKIAARPTARLCRDAHPPGDLE